MRSTSDDVPVLARLIQNPWLLAGSAILGLVVVGGTVVWFLTGDDTGDDRLSFEEFADEYTAKPDFYQKTTYWRVPIEWEGTFTRCSDAGVLVFQPPLDKLVADGRVLHISYKSNPKSIDQWKAIEPESEVRFRGMVHRWRSILFVTKAEPSK